ncbi:hypothetical protein LDENG_00032380 [Lucifuga dentata]|nr:hypothetical protein LDENG_00032380 [Lucifuga dentata]
MTKGRMKINGSVPPQPRSLRSRKRECPSDQTSPPDNVQVALSPQDTEGTFATVVGTQPQSPKSPLQECSKTSPAQLGTAEQSFLTEQEAEHLEAPNVDLKHLIGEVVEGIGQEEMMKGQDEKDKEEMREQGCSRSPPCTCTDLQALFQTSKEEGDACCATGLEAQEDAMENSERSSERQSCLAKPSLVPGTGEIGEPEPDPPAGKREHFSSHERQELRGSTTETTVHEKQVKDGSGEVTHSPLTFPTLSHNEGTEKETQDGSHFTPLQMDSVSGTRDGNMGSVGVAADSSGVEEGTSSTNTQPGGLDCHAVELFNVTETPSGSEGKDTFPQSDPVDKPGTGPSPVSAEQPQTRNIPDIFGSGCLDYVSDSQLNNIVLIRTVMATHRELENLRRGSKGTRGSSR